MMTLLRRRAALLTLLALAGTGQAATANPLFPSQELQIVVPADPGGGVDLLARLLAKRWTATLGQPALVINRSGASGNVGTVSVARADADGHTLLMTGVGLLVSPLLHSKPGYDALKDFEPVARIATAPNVLMVHESLKGLSLSQLLQDPRSRAGGLAYASAGYGQSSHLAAELFMARTGVRWLHVPYRGTNPATLALLAGEVQVMFVPASSALALLAKGRVHALAVAHPQRLAGLPGTPTLGELGIQGADFSQWYGLLAPAGTPAPALAALQNATLAFAADPEIQRQLQAMGMEPGQMARAEFASYLAAQARRLATLVKVERVESANN